LQKSFSSLTRAIHSEWKGFGPINRFMTILAIVMIPPFWSWLEGMYQDAISTWKPGLAEIQANKQAGEIESLQRTFPIFDSNKSSFSIDCPGIYCMQFQMTGVQRGPDGLFEQTIVLTGNGFNYQQGRTANGGEYNLLGVPAKIFAFAYLTLPLAVNLTLGKPTGVILYADKVTVVVSWDDPESSTPAVKVSLIIPPRKIDDISTYEKIKEEIVKASDEE
jgi:hypothetical protein